MTTDTAIRRDAPGANKQSRLEAAAHSRARPAGAALARDEPRGLLYRTDVGGPTPDRAHRLLVGGLDRIWTRYDAQPRHQTLTEAAA